MRLFNSDFINNISKLGVGVILSQIIGLISYPIITRIYSPEVFGLFGLFNSIIIIGSLTITGAYEFSIPLVRYRKEVWSLVANSFLLSLGFSIIVGFFLVLMLIAQSLTHNNHTGYLLLLPLGLLFHSSISIKSQVYTYQKNFSNFSKAKVFQVVSLSVSQILFGLINPGLLSLFGGFLFGRMNFILFDIKSFLRSIKQEISNRTFVYTLIRYNEQPKYVLPSNIISAISREAPIFLIIHFYNQEDLGQYNLAYRVLFTPVFLVASSLSSVLYQKISNDVINDVKIFKKIKRLTISLFFIGIGPSIVLFLFGEEIFQYVFGNNWIFAGKISGYLSFMLLFRFIYQPTSKLFLALRLQSLLPTFSIVSLIFTIISFYIGTLFNSLDIAIVAFSYFSSGLYIIQILILLRKSHLHDKGTA